MALGRPSLATILSLNAGFVDTSGFLALQGLFTAHVTGNFVTLGASAVFGLSGALAKLLALPVFCATVIAVRLASYRLEAHGVPVLRTLLVVKLVLLALAGLIAIRLGPFPKGDSVAAITTGMVLVAAMAIQNALHRIHLATAPPTTLMTGTTTQMMIDIADLVRGGGADPSATHGRLRRMGAAVGAFAIGCAGGALLYALAGVWCFAFPPVVAAAALLAAGDAAPAKG